MANRYWVGGNGGWSAAGTTNWSASPAISFTASCSGTTLTTTGSPALVVGMTVYNTVSTNLGTITGGSGNTWTVSIGGTVASTTMSAATVGASAPTLSDDVFFNSTSGVGTSAYSISNGGNGACNNYTVSGLSGALTWSNFGVINIYGSLSISGGNWTSTFYGSWTFPGTATGRTIDVGGVYIGGQVVLTGVGSTVSLSSAISCQGFVFTNGTFNTNNFTITLLTGASGTNAVSNTGTGTTVVNLGSSTITSGTTTIWNFATTTGLTFNAGTSNLSINGITFAGGGLTYYNVTLGNTTVGGNFTTPALNVTGANTFNNLTMSGPSTDGSKLTVFAANQTINGTFTCVGSTVLRRNLFVSSPRSNTSQITLTCAAVSFANIDFYGVIIAGAAAPVDGTLTGLGDAGYNSGITFPTAKTVYWNLATGGTTYSTAWATTSGGTPAVANFPLPHDIAVIGNTGLNSGAIITNSYTGPNLDLSTRTVAMTFNSASGTSYQAGYINSPSTLVTFGSGCNVIMYNKALYAGGTFTAGAIVQTFGTVDITASNSFANFTLNNGTLNLLAGMGITTGFTFSQTSAGAGPAAILNLNSYNITCGNSFASGVSTRTINFGTGSITVTNNSGGTPGIAATGLTVTGSRTFILGGSGASTVGTTLQLTNFTEANAFDLYLNSSRTYTLTIQASSFVRNLIFTDFTGGTLANTTLTVYGDVTFPASVGTFTAGTNAWTFAGSGTQTLTTNSKTIDWPLTKSGTGTIATSGNFTMGSTRALTFTSGTISVGAGTTLTVGSFVTSGTTLKYLASTVSGTQGNITKASGTTTVTYMNIKDSAASGGVWSALDATNVNGGNNSGWLIAGTLGSAFFLMLRK